MTNTPLRTGLKLCVLCALVTGCGSASDMAKVAYTDEVEIAPGEWLTIQGGDTVNAADLRPNPKDPHNLSPLDALKQVLGSGSSWGGGGGDRERSSLSFEWQGKQVTWRGKEIPITLREHDGTLYMIGFNRSNTKKKRFVYFRLKDTGKGFRKIKPKDFPKVIATQNMWLRGVRVVGVHTAETGTVWIDTWQVLRKLDIGSLHFSTSMTARIWYQLVEGVERHEMPHLIPSEFLQEYVANYHPIALPTLVKEAPVDAEAADPPDVESQ